MDKKEMKNTVQDSRVLMYLNAEDITPYKNTAREQKLLELWDLKYQKAKQAYESSRANSRNVSIWRAAYEGDFRKLDENGQITDEEQIAIRKLCFELVQSKMNSHIPDPKMTSKKQSDIIPINATEQMIKYEMDNMLTEKLNNLAEMHCLVDGTVWFKVGWNPFDNSHESSGSPEITVCPVDTVFPQPGILDFTKLEYIFEESRMTIAQCYDLFGRYIAPPDDSDVFDVVICYFLNKDRYLGRFIWCKSTGQVISNELEWGIHKRRECMECEAVLPIQDICPLCGSDKIHYVSVKEEILEREIKLVKNPYRTRETDDEQQDENVVDEEQSIPAGTKIPYYLIRQLPFVPYTRVAVPNSIYGISEIELSYEAQDMINKLLNKACKKMGESKTYVVSLVDTFIENTSSEITNVKVETAQEASSIQVKQALADITQEMTAAQQLYDVSKSTSGVTNTDQGKQDGTALSGKAKQVQIAASNQLKIAPTELRNVAYSEVYKLIYKHLISYSDEERYFVSTLPDGKKMQEMWSKYMFLSKDKYGEYYYKDSFAWSVDSATEITKDRAAMWQLIDNDYINGTMGNAVDPARANLLYWQLKDQQGYPTAKFAIDFLMESVQHLPSSIETALLNNPDAVEIALSYIADKSGNGPVSQANGMSTGQQGGARPNSGQKGNGQTHSANVEKTNNKNRSQSGAGQTNSSAISSGGMQGGTASPTNMTGGVE